MSYKSYYQQRSLKVQINSYVPIIYILYTYFYYVLKHIDSVIDDV